jgi:hypothetical protein
VSYGDRSAASRAPVERLEVEENGPARDLGAEKPNGKIADSALNASN